MFVPYLSKLDFFVINYILTKKLIMFHYTEISI